MISRLIDISTCGSLIIDVPSLWNYWNLKNRLFQFSGTERVKTSQHKDVGDKAFDDQYKASCFKIIRNRNVQQECFLTFSGGIEM